MHHGKLASLEQVIAHYIKGGIDSSRTTELLEPLELNAGEVKDLINFLHSLTGDDPVIAAPTLPH